MDKIIRHGDTVKLQNGNEGVVVAIGPDYADVSFYDGSEIGVERVEFKSGEKGAEVDEGKRDNSLRFKLELLIRRVKEKALKINIPVRLAAHEFELIESDKKKREMFEIEKLSRTSGRLAFAGRAVKEFTWKRLLALIYVKLIYCVFSRLYR